MHSVTTWSFRRRSLLRVGVLLGPILAPPLIVSAQEQTSADSWRSTSAAERMAYVHGVQQTSFVIPHLARLVTREMPPTTQDEQELVRSLSPNQRRLIQRVADATYSRFDVSTPGKQAVIDVMSDLYRDPSNAWIDFTSMLRVAVMKLGGATVEAVDRELAIQRKLWAEEAAKRRVRPN